MRLKIITAPFVCIVLLSILHTHEITDDGTEIARHLSVPSSKIGQHCNLHTRAHTHTHTHTHARTHMHTHTHPSLFNLLGAAVVLALRAVSLSDQGNIILQPNGYWSLTQFYLIYTPSSAFLAMFPKHFC